MTTTKYAQQQLAQQFDGRNVLARDLAKMVNSLAYAEGFEYAKGYIEEVFENHGQAAAIGLAMRLLTEGADDTWSGRANDVNRARFDGIRAYVNDNVYGILSIDMAVRAGS